jgi:hypothetical protein
VCDGCDPNEAKQSCQRLVTPPDEFLVVGVDPGQSPVLDRRSGTGDRVLVIFQPLAKRLHVEAQADALERLALPVTDEPSCDRGLVRHHGIEDVRPDEVDDTHATRCEICENASSRVRVEQFHADRTRRTA